LKAIQILLLVGWSPLVLCVLLGCKKDPGRPSQDDALAQFS
jgi:hypothetical protein